jgi:hypothetical protein
VVVRLVAVLLLAATFAGGIAGATTAAATQPSLRLGSESPLMFSGSGFRSGEHVRVVAVAGRRAVHWVTAGSRGRFVVRFRGMNADVCRGLAAVAVGDEGSRATYKRAPGVCPAP